MKSSPFVFARASVFYTQLRGGGAWAPGRSSRLCVLVKTRNSLGVLDLEPVPLLVEQVNVAVLKGKRHFGANAQV